MQCINSGSMFQFPKTSIPIPYVQPEYDFWSDACSGFAWAYICSYRPKLQIPFLSSTNNFINVAPSRFKMSLAFHTNNRTNLLSLTCPHEEGKFRQFFFGFFDRDGKRTSKSCKNILKDIAFGNLLYNQTIGQGYIDFYFRGVHGM